jgi:hypothetical protein
MGIKDLVELHLHHRSVVDISISTGNVCANFEVAAKEPTRNRYLLNVSRDETSSGTRTAFSVPG